MTATTSHPVITRADPDTTPRAVVLLLHGGKPSSRQAVDGRSASWRRARALQRAITPAAHERGVATWLLRYRERGWNDPGAPAPVNDARWALQEVRRHLGDVPVALLGHSMGARTAVRVADDPLVRGVVALAPWFPPEDPVHLLDGKTLVAAHGRRDRITSARATRLFVQRAAAAGADAEFVDMGGVGHYLLRDAARWNRVAQQRTLALLP